MWCGFGVLVIGALLQPIVAVAAPLPGASVLLITALIAFVVAGSRIGSARFPVLQGAVAAVASYALVLPLVLLSSTEVGPSQVLTTAGVAVAVGSVAGFGAHLLRKRGRNA
jgi:hypothetical protein